jgi:hypothetical protein
MQILGVVVISSASLLVTVIWHRYIFRKIFWRPILLVIIGGAQMTFLVLSHGGSDKLLRCGVCGAAAIAALVLLAGGPRMRRDLVPQDIGVLIVFLSLVPFILEWSMP